MYSNEYLLNKIYLRLVISTISLGIEPEKELLSGVRVMLEQEQKKRGERLIIIMMMMTMIMIMMIEKVEGAMRYFTHVNQESRGSSAVQSHLEGNQSNNCYL